MLKKERNLRLRLKKWDKVKYQDSKASVFEYFGVPDTNYPSVGYDVEMVDIPIENKKKSYIISHGVVKFDVADMGGSHLWDIGF